jgi:hypothetical protein
MDVLSMAALLNLLASLLEYPMGGKNIPASDQAAIGRLYEELGYLDNAELHYQACLEAVLPGELRINTILDLAALRKRRNDYHNALPLWEQAAAEGNVDACIELAKYYEHKDKDFSCALTWAQAAKNMIDSPSYSSLERLTREGEIHHRLTRLISKVEGNAD